MIGNNLGTIILNKKLQSFENQLIGVFKSTQSRDRTGMEVNPLVFETSASTDSAIWACRRRVQR